MEFFRIKKDIPFMKYALVFNAISFITFALAVFFLLSRGLHLSVEFTGGTVMEVAYSQPADIGKVRDTIAKTGYSDVTVQNFGTSKDVMIRLPVQKGVTSAQQSEQVLTALKAQDADVTMRRTEFVGPQVGVKLAFFSFAVKLKTSFPVLVCGVVLAWVVHRILRSFCAQICAWFSLSHRSDWPAVECSNPAGTAPPPSLIWGLA